MSTKFYRDVTFKDRKFYYHRWLGQSKIAETIIFWVEVSVKDIILHTTHGTFPINKTYNPGMLKLDIRDNLELIQEIKDKYPEHFI